MRQLLPVAEMSFSDYFFVDAEPGEEAVELPLVGIIPAGRPIEALEQQETVTVPPHFLSSGQRHFALRVAGTSMLDEGIRDGDIVVIRQQAIAKNGQTVVALIDDAEVTLKKYYFAEGNIELRPANTAFASLFLSPGRVKIQGIVVGLLRKY